MDVNSSFIYKSHKLETEIQVSICRRMGKLFVIDSYDRMLKWSEVAQSCPTPCNPMDCSLQGSSVLSNKKYWNTDRSNGEISK